MRLLFTIQAPSAGTAVAAASNLAARINTTNAASALLSAPGAQHTGVVLDVDGGHGVRQYADAATDPMRRGDG